MAQSARTAVRSTPRSRQQFAIARRMAARKIAAGAGTIEHRDPGMLAACIEAAGFDDHRSY